MKTKAIFLVFAAMVATSASMNAQGLLRRAINRHIEHKIDSAVDKSIQNQENEQNNKNAGQSESKDNSTRATGRGLFGGKIDIKYNDDYNFTGRMYMQIESYDNNKPVLSDYYTYYSSKTPDAGIEMSIPDQKEKTGPTVFLIDGVNRCFIMLLGSTDSKTGIISELPSDSAMAAMAKKQKGENPEDAIITSTGKTRTIAGYKCTEYKATDKSDGSWAYVWVTRDLKLNANRAYWGKAGIPTYYNYPGFGGGVILAVESYDKNDKLDMKMETKEIDQNYPHSISTSGYTFMKMNFSQSGRKK